jgi:hypothetical protein
MRIRQHDIPAEPSVGLMRAMLGPRSTTRPNVLDGLDSSNGQQLSLEQFLNHAA